jgi:hypothetical protein
MKRMAKDLSGTGCPVVFQEKGWLVICQKQELTVKDTKTLWFVRNTIADGLSVRGFLCMPGGLYHGQEYSEI